MDAWIELAANQHRLAAKRGEWDGRGPTPYFLACRQEYFFAGCTSIFTRDVGYHTSGWWKNPDYERCKHLSLSYFDPATCEPADKNATTTEQFIAALFGDHKRWLWCEPPYSQDGKRLGVWHYRLFCDEHWQPIKPRGEVYSTELTEAGWHSYSDVQAEIERTGLNPNVRKGGWQCEP